MNHQNLTTILWRGACGRCPRCGRGALFSGYLQQNAACPDCGQDFTAFRAEDGPAWLTILVTGHIVVPVAVHMARGDDNPGMAALAFLLGLTIACVFILLPRCKGVFVAMLWFLAEKKAQALISGKKIQS